MALGTPSPGPLGELPAPLADLPDRDEPRAGEHRARGCEGNLLWPGSDWPGSDWPGRALPGRDVPARQPTPRSRQRWTIGGVYPRGSTSDRKPRRWRVSTELLVRGRRPRLSVEARFLQIVDVEVLAAADDDTLAPRDPAVAGPAPAHADEEARERALVVERVRLDGSGSACTPIAISAGSDRTPLGSGEVVVRRWAALLGELEIRWTRLEPEVLRVGVAMTNIGGWHAMGTDVANRQAMMAAHVLLRVDGGSFVSSLEPPQELERAVLACRNEGLFPVLIGGPAAHDRVLASPVILYDGPDMSRESQAGLFDHTQVDHRAILSALTLTAPPSPEAVIPLNGAIRDWRVLRPAGFVGAEAATDGPQRAPEG